MLKELYNATKTRLNAIGVMVQPADPDLEPVFVRTLQNVDLWNNQYAYADQYKVMRFPHVFVEFAQMPMEQLGNKVQQGTATIRLHVGSRTLNDQDLNHFDLLDIITYWMAGFQGSNFGTWTRTAIEVDNDHDLMIAHILTFKVRITDLSAVRTYVKVEGDLLFIQKAILNGPLTPAIPPDEVEV